MLPSILKVAREYDIVINERTIGQKEVRAKCPFCGGDYPDKFHLSLNEEMNVFRCWNCKQNGGVLQFESLVSGKGFNEVRKKYFGSQKKQKAVHPALRLSPEQLDAIGWRSVKRKNFKSFNQSREDVLRDWEVYKYEELVKYYAVFLLIAHFPVSDKKRSLYSWFSSATKSSKVEDLKSLLVNEYKHPQHPIWATRAKEIARIAYESTRASGDFGYINLFVNVLIAIEVAKLQRNKRAKMPV